MKKYLLSFTLLSIGLMAWGQTAEIAIAPTDNFQFSGASLHHYGVGFHSYVDGMNLYGSGYFGVNLFTEGQNRLRIARNGFVGIGTTNPLYKLHIDGGNLFIRNSSNADGFGNGSSITISNNYTNTFGKHASLVFSNSNAGTTPLAGISGIYDSWTQTYGSGMRLSFYTKNGNGESNPSEKMVITGDGNIGIGTSNPSSRLEVAGKISANQITVNQFVSNLPLVTENWNDEWQNGFFDATNLPSSPESGWFWGINIGHRSNTKDYRYGGQLLIKNSPNEPTLYFRSKGQQGEGTWARVINSVGNQRINGELGIDHGLTIGNYGDRLGWNGTGTQPGYHIRFAGYRDVAGGVTGAKISALRTNLCCDALAQGMELAFYVTNGIEWASTGDVNLREAMRINDNGNVGIGKTKADTKLDVAGTIRATEIKVEAQTADFVFDDNYALRDLKEVESFITQHKHLPDIPSAAQMEADGVNLAEMNKLLLQKIEELTLYIIELEKKNALQEAQLDKIGSIEDEIGSIKTLLKELNNKK